MKQATLAYSSELTWVIEVIAEYRSDLADKCRRDGVWVADLLVTVDDRRLAGRGKVEYHGPVGESDVSIWIVARSELVSA